MFRRNISLLSCGSYSKPIKTPMAEGLQAHLTNGGDIFFFATSNSKIHGVTIRKTVLYNAKNTCPPKKNFAGAVPLFLCTYYSREMESEFCLDALSRSKGRN
jgi:hypothetical protein